MCSQTKRQKSCSFDNISVYTLKHIIHLFSQPLTKIVNTSFSRYIFPDFCKFAKIIPVFKSGYVHEYTNYKPISIFSKFSKIFEKLMLVKLC